MDMLLLESCNLSLGSFGPLPVDLRPIDSELARLQET